MALKLSDLSASHLELISLVKTPELMEPSSQVGQFLISRNFADGEIVCKAA